ncbi:MAG: response regulator, partial [Candidatus Thermoplasmatota archaeon]|nr:response regulator [Candidatus Thermoplasmatota archaeon]
TSPEDERDLMNGNRLELRVPVTEGRGRRMGKTLNVLLIEDSEDDAMLIVHELEHGGYDVDFERCDSADAIKDALSRREWDVILSDHAMPRICAPEALQIVRQSMVETPFVVVSGWMDETLAQSVKREGARDLVPKNKLARLVPVIERELESGKKTEKTRTPAKKGKK